MKDDAHKYYIKRAAIPILSHNAETTERMIVLSA